MFDSGKKIIYAAFTVVDLLLQLSWHILGFFSAIGALYYQVVAALLKATCTLPWWQCFILPVFALRLLSRMLIVVLDYVEGTIPSPLVETSERGVLNGIVESTWSKTISLKLASVIEKCMIEDLNKSSLVNEAVMKQFSLGKAHPIIDTLELRRDEARDVVKQSRSVSPIPVVMDVGFRWQAPDALVVLKVRSKFGLSITASASQLGIAGKMTIELTESPSPSLFPFRSYRAYFNEKPDVTLTLAFGSPTPMTNPVVTPASIVGSNCGPACLTQIIPPLSPPSPPLPSLPKRSLARRLFLSSFDKLVRATIRTCALYPRSIQGEL